MKELKRGMFARSLAGHDKGCLYIVLEADEKQVLLTDGRNRPLEKPKRKNRIHIQPDFEDSGVFSADVPRHPEEQNAAVRKVIKAKEDKGCQKQM